MTSVKKTKKTYAEEIWDVAIEKGWTEFASAEEWEGYRNRKRDRSEEVRYIKKPPPLDNGMTFDEFLLRVKGRDFGVPEDGNDFELLRLKLDGKFNFFEGDCEWERINSSKTKPSVSTSVMDDNKRRNDGKDENHFDLSQVGRGLGKLTLPLKGKLEYATKEDFLKLRAELRNICLGMGQLHVDKLEALGHRLGGKIDDLTKQVCALNQRVDTVNQRVDAIENRLDGSNTSVSDHSTAESREKEVKETIKQEEEEEENEGEAPEEEEKIEEEEEENVESLTRGESLKKLVKQKCEDLMKLYQEFESPPHPASKKEEQTSKKNPKKKKVPSPSRKGKGGKRKNRRRNKKSNKKKNQKNNKKKQTYDPDKFLDQMAKKGEAERKRQKKLNMKESENQKKLASSKERERVMQTYNRKWYPIFQKLYGESEEFGPEKFKEMDRLARAGIMKMTVEEVEFFDSNQKEGIGKLFVKEFVRENEERENQK